MNSTRRFPSEFDTMISVGGGEACAAQASSPASARDASHFAIGKPLREKTRNYVTARSGFLVGGLTNDDGSRHASDGNGRHRHRPRTQSRFARHRSEAGGPESSRCDYAFYPPSPMDDDLN